MSDTESDTRNHAPSPELLGPAASMLLLSAGALGGLLAGVVAALSGGIGIDGLAGTLALWTLTGAAAGAATMLIRIAISRGCEPLWRTFTYPPHRARTRGATMIAALALSALWIPVLQEVAARPIVSRSRAGLLIMAGLCALALLGGVVLVALVRRHPLPSAKWLTALLVPALALPLLSDTLLPLGPLPRTRLALVVACLIGALLPLQSLLARTRRAPVLGLALILAAASTMKIAPDPEISAVRSDTMEAALRDLVPREGAPRVSDEVMDVSAWFGRSRSPFGEELDRLTPERRRLNVLWITVCTLRRDRLGAQGSGRNLTPALDRLASESIVFERAYTPFPASALAMDAMFTGRYPFQTNHYRRQVGLPARPDEPWLPRRLLASGRVTWGLTAFDAGMLKGEFQQLLDGFQIKNPYPNILGAKAPVITASFEKLLVNHPPKSPFFAWIHLMDPHAPYDGDPEAEHEGATPEARYDGEVRATDRQIGRILASLNQRGLRDTTMVVLCGDHGEEFGEHGGSFHYTSVYEEQVAVPMMIRVPGIAPRRTREPVDLTDLAPTVTDILGDVQPWVGAGDSLVPLMLGHPLPGVAFTEVLWPDRPGATRRALVGFGDRKLILRGKRPHKEFYDLGQDPGEESDLGARGETARKMERIIRGLLAQSPGELGAFPRLPGARVPDAVSGSSTDRALLRRVLAGPETGQQTETLLLALAATVTLRDAEAARLAIRYLDHPHAEARLGALRAVSVLKIREAAPQIRKRLDDDDARVRLAALRTLVRLKPEKALEWIHDDPGRPQAERMERMVSRCLLGDPSGLQEQMRSIDTLDPELKGRVLAALSEAGSEAARNKLREALNSTRTPPALVSAALFALQRAGDPAAERHLLGARRAVRLPGQLMMAVLEASGAVTEERRAIVLASLGHPDPLVRKTALEQALQLWKHDRTRNLSAAWDTYHAAWENPADREQARLLLRGAQVDISRWNLR